MYAWLCTFSQFECVLSIRQLVNWADLHASEKASRNKAWLYAHKTATADRATRKLFRGGVFFSHPFRPYPSFPSTFPTSGEPHLQSPQTFQIHRKCVYDGAQCDFQFTNEWTVTQSIVVIAANVKMTTSQWSKTDLNIGQFCNDQTYRTLQQPQLTSNSYCTKKSHTDAEACTQAASKPTKVAQVAPNLRCAISQFSGGQHRFYDGRLL